VERALWFIDVRRSHEWPTGAPVSAVNLRHRPRQLRRRLLLLLWPLSWQQMSVATDAPVGQQDVLTPHHHRRAVNFVVP